MRNSTALSSLISNLFLKNKLYQAINPDEVVELQRFVVFRIFSYTALLVCLGVFSKMVLTLSNVNWLPWFVLLLGFIILINYLRLKSPQQLPNAYLIMLVAVLIVLHCVAYTCGGIRTGGTFFMSAVIIYSFMLLGKSKGWLIAGLAAVHVVYMFVISSYTNWTSFSLFDERIDLINEDFLTNILLTFLLISALSSYLQSNRNEFYKKIIQSKHDLERINLQLKEKNESLKNKNAELAKFTSVAAHDLRSPLRAIGSLVDMVLEDERLMSGESQERLNLVRKRAVRMDKLLTALSDYSQIDKKLGEPQEVNTRYIIDNIINRYSHKNNIEFKSPESNFKIFTSKIALSRVFEEIITNAIKFNDKEFIQIDISAKKSNDTWHFSVRDNGPGIQDDFKTKVFIIFQTLEARDKFESAGAGLAIARKLVNESKGEIWLSSENNSGVTFHFTWKESNHQPKKVSPISDNPIRKSA